MQTHLTRRNLLLLAGAGLTGIRLNAASGDFWNKKPPSQWTTQEIDQLITKSPWAKEVKAQYAPGESPSSSNAGGYPGGSQGGGYPGGNQGGGRPRGGIGIPERDRQDATDSIVPRGGRRSRGWRKAAIV